MKKPVYLDFLLPLLLLAAATLILWISQADILISRFFYSPENGWFLRNEEPWHFLYRHGNIPPLVLGISGLLFFLLGFVRPRLAPYRKIGFFLVLFLVLGPGLLVNSVLKDHWGRPRPVSIVEFGGTENFLPVWKKGTAGQGKSFPSGHAAVGFFLFSPFFFLRRVAERWAVFFLLLGISYGLFMGIGRMIQGGHFASDILWAGGLIYLIGLGLAHLFRFREEILWTPKAGNTERILV